MSTDLVPFKDYAIAQVDQERLRETIQANLGGAQLTEFDLDRIKIPSGGGSAWEVPMLDGTDTAKEIVGVIAHHKTVRSYWKVSLDESGGGTPPDCSSPDNVWGYGDPGDQLRANGTTCADCPMAQFGSDERGRGQACKESHLLFLLPPGELLPWVVSLPPTSLGNCKKFLARLTSKAVPFYSVMVALSLEKVKGQGVPDYAVAQMKMVERLSPEDTDRVKKLGVDYRQVFERVTVQDAGEAGAGREPAAGEA